MPSIIWAILVLGIIILIHELGHFLVAKAVGIRVHEFALGFGPKLMGVTRGETTYSVRAFLLGGFVRMAGMDGADATDARGFAAKSVGQRMAVIAAGPLMNFLLAAVIFAAGAAVVGEPRDAVVGGTRSGLPAAAAGLRPGDQVLAVNGLPTRTWTDLQRAIEAAKGGAIEVSVRRGAETFALQIQPVLDPESKRHIIGVEPKIYPVGPLKAVREGMRSTVFLTRSIFVQLGQMVVGQVEPQVAGPVGIVRAVAETSQHGFLTLLQLMAMLSINVGILNLLPFPALDGSRLVFLGVETLRGRPISAARENMIHLVGFVLLLGLMVVITYTELAF